MTRYLSDWERYQLVERWRATSDRRKGKTTVKAPLTAEDRAADLARIAELESLGMTREAAAVRKAHGLPRAEAEDDDMDTLQGALTSLEATKLAIERAPLDEAAELEKKLAHELTEAEVMSIALTSHGLKH